MEITVTWRELFPFPDEYGKDPNHTKVMEFDPDDTNDMDIVEKAAILDTPDGCFLYQIEYPHTVVTYDQQGNKSEQYKTTR